MIGLFFAGTATYTANFAKLRSKSSNSAQNLKLLPQTRESTGIFQSSPSSLLNASDYEEKPRDEQNYQGTSSEWGDRAIG